MPEVRLIDANALMRMICGNECGCTPEECGIEENKYDPAACNYRSYISEMPTIEAEPVRRGRWNYRHEDDWCYCTACGTDAEGSDGECLETDYCPHCGARMGE